ncbi:hypothetical protein CC86DRAFT_449042 [Ophiobolus disseminans]|uniref:Uncharacterized protein n=1 Tax=Ophiobolus disseminans TaxID=1469910 RepID=A0A6A6ZLA1_9PLEO|nr:hypothetical protein CC86DRAFT_449042 [Ophiobolus disseminans]
MRCSHTATPNQGQVSRKRKSTGTSQSAAVKNRRKGTEMHAETEEQVVHKPRLVTPDLEFDYDRSQLLKAHLGNTREIPKPEKPSGRHNAAQKDQLFTEEARINPLLTFHNLHRCYYKGRDGSPTYDDGGFQLDYDKVAEWLKPQPYNRQKMIRGMERALFFVKMPKNRECMRYDVKDYMLDYVSKDFGIPFHQVKPEQVKIWRDKRFQPEDGKRMRNLEAGVSLRKDI